MFGRRFLIGSLLFIQFYTYVQSSSQSGGNFRGNCLGCTCSCYYSTITRYNTSLLVGFGVNTCIGGSCRYNVDCDNLCFNSSICMPHFSTSNCYTSGTTTYFLECTIVLMSFIFHLFIK